MSQTKKNRLRTGGFCFAGKQRQAYAIGWLMAMIQ